MSSAPNLPTEQLLELLLTLKKTTPAAARTILNGQPAIAYALITLMVSMNAINVEVFQKTLAAATSSSSTSVAPPSLVPGAIPPHVLANPSSSTPPIHPHPSSSNPSSLTPIPAIPPHMQQYPSQNLGQGQNQYRMGTPPQSQHQSHTPPTQQAIYGGYPVNGYPPTAASATPPLHAPPSQGQGYGGVAGPGPAVYQGQGPSSHLTPPPNLYASTSYGGASQGYGGAPQGHGQGPPPPPGGGYGHVYHDQGQGQSQYGQGYGGVQPSQQSQSIPPAALAETLAAIPDDQKALIMRVISMTPDQIHALPPQERSTYIQIRATLGVATPGG